MNQEPKQNKFLRFLFQPWILETIFFFLVLWQESFRLSARTAQRTLPLSAGLQDFYYFHFGDFVNGFGIAYLIDGAMDRLVFKTRPYYNVLGKSISKQTNAFLATLASIGVVVIFELTQSISTTSDYKDIPAGICGALVYCAVRVYALKWS